MLIDAMHTKWQAQWQCDGSGGWLERALHIEPPHMEKGLVLFCGICFIFRMIKCSKCKQIKASSEFYKGTKRCKQCALEYQREWQAKNLTSGKAAEYRARFAQKNPGYATAKRKEWAIKNPERAKEIERQRYEREKARRPPKLPKVKLTASEKTRRSLANNPVRAAAMKIYKYAIRRGKLIRGPCAVCGATEGIDGHHTDYTKPLEVVWLCKPHHREEHAKLKCEAA